MLTKPISSSSVAVPASAPVARVGKPSLWVWVPWIWLFFTASRSLSTWMDWGRQSASANLDLANGSPVDRLLMLVLMGAGAYVLAKRFKQTKRILLGNKWMLVLFAYMALSILWSNFPGISFRRFNRNIGTLEMVLIILTEPYPLEAIRALLRRLYVVHVALSVAAIKYVRNIGVAFNWSGQEEEWIGISTDKNSLGQVAMCSGLFWIWQLLQDWRKRRSKRKLLVFSFRFVMLGFTLWLLRGSRTSHSSTAIVGFVICSLLLFGLQLLRSRPHRAKSRVLSFVAACALAAPFAYLLVYAVGTTPVETLVGATGRNMTLTGRTALWADILNDAQKSPVVGVGVGAFWVGSIGYEMYPLPNWSLETPGWRPEEGHNGFIDTYAELGIIGVVLLLIVIGVGFAGALNDLKYDFQLACLRLVFLLIIILNNITETSFLRGEHDLWFLFLLMAINIPRLKSKTEMNGVGASTGRAANRNPLPYKASA